MCRELESYWCTGYKSSSSPKEGMFKITPMVEVQHTKKKRERANQIK